MTAYQSSELPFVRERFKDPSQINGAKINTELSSSNSGHNDLQPRLEITSKL